MTIDDLVKVFRSKAWPIPMKDGGEGSDREGVIAIVRALRDETRHMTLNRDSLEELFTQILGDAGEKVAEGIAERADEQRADAPATDPIRDAAPAVCVWRGSKDGQLAYMGCTKRLEWTYDRRKCPSCGKPIKFTEAK